MDIIFALALTTHVDLNQPLNEIHPHIRIEHNNFVAGVFVNSLQNRSTYVGRVTDLTENLSIEYGAATGYDFYPVVPFGRATYQLTDHTKLFIAPGVGTVLGIEIFF
jgi:hypothetical protein